MSICYLCGQQMIDAAVYNADPTKFIEKPKIKHDEHIIQDAIYGRITDADVLCLTCGSQLSNEIDADFVKIFQTLTEQFAHMLASKAKGNNFNKSLKGHVKLHDGRQKMIFMKAGKIYPAQPFYDDPIDGVVKVYGEAKAAKQFVTHVKSELRGKSYNVENLTFEIIDDLQEYIELAIHFSEGIDDFNRKFKMGFAKIATGFASKHGVDRSLMPNTLGAVNNCMIDKDCLVAFAGPSIFDKVYDPLRLVLEPEYPSHTLILYVDKSSELGKLVCYIDLFSTFQYYVILNDNYVGPDVHGTYYQMITKLEKPDINVPATRPKHLMIIQEMMEIDPKETKGMKLDQLYDFLEIKYKQWNLKYRLDLGETIKGLATKLAINIIASQTGKLDMLSGVEQELTAAIPQLSTDEVLVLREEFVRIDHDHPNTFYRQNYLDIDDEEGGVSAYSSLLKALQIQHENPEKVKRYTHSKFQQLDYYIKNNKPLKS